MDILLYVVAVLFGVVGCIGCIVPVLPGVMLSYIGYLCLYFVDGSGITTTWMIVFGVMTLAVSILDYLLPSLMTKQFGGTKAGERGAMAGVLAGIFFGPIGIIVMPFIGAIVGELIYDSSDRNRALKSGLGSFLSFFVGTGMKLAVSIWITIDIIKEIISTI